jgi:hypothetical protein
LVAGGTDRRSARFADSEKVSMLAQELIDARATFAYRARHVSSTQGTVQRACRHEVVSVELGLTTSVLQLAESAHRRSLPLGDGTVRSVGRTKLFVWEELSHAAYFTTRAHTFLH